MREKRRDISEENTESGRQCKTQGQQTCGTAGEAGEQADSQKLQKEDTDRSREEAVGHRSPEEGEAEKEGEPTEQEEQEELPEEDEPEYPDYLEEDEEPEYEQETDDTDEWSEEDDWEDEEEAEPTKPWKAAAVFIGLILTAAVICAALWHFSHRDKPEGNGAGIQNESSGAPSSGGQSQASDSAVQGTEGGEGTGASDQTVREPVSGTEDMEFEAVQESVTPKDVINLRSVPTTLDDGNIVMQARNGQTLLRTGINNDTGWSRIEYEGQILYGVTQYLTTDLDYKPPVQSENPNRVSTKDGSLVIFADCNDWLSPKEYVNLRTEPSTSGGDGTVSCQLNSGEKVHRTGLSPDSGWSRVEYNGQVLYVVTSLMQTVEGEAGTGAEE